MSCTTDGITHVRVRPLALDLAPDGTVAGPGAVEVTWHSTHEDRWHQVYVNGRLAGVSTLPADRRLAVTVPAGRSGRHEMLLVEVAAVEAPDRWTDFADTLTGFGPGAGAEVRLTWQAGLYLDPNLEVFDVFGDGATGTVDYDSPLNELPVPARPGGRTPWGYGTGGYGIGAYGQAAAEYAWTTDLVVPGTHRFAVVAADAAGNRLATAAEVQIAVCPLPRPPEDFRVTLYDPNTRVATLAWDPSPDL
ncbi:MAG: hypothetical protein U9R68_10250 [Planctomycetota bacterium]|nr:hypothetical protein [Planctomycetota bacterium]